MWIDILIAIGFCVVAALMGYLGVHVTLHAQTDPKNIRRFKLSFVGAALLMCCLVAIQTIRTYKSGEAQTKGTLGDPEHPPFVAVISLPNLTRFVTTNSSDYAVYITAIQLLDADACGDGTRNYGFSELSPHSAVMDERAWHPAPNANNCRFIATIFARNGTFTEEMMLHRTDNNQWMRALRVKQGERTLVRDVDSEWPRDKNGDFAALNGKRQ
jgi:hypothetical protein